MINGNMIGIGSAPLKTVILTDENGNEITGVCVENVQVFDATVNDVREGKTFVSDDGAQVGEKFIPPYYTTKGYKVITAGSEIKVVLNTLDAYDYTAFQCLVCPLNTSIANSVATEKVVIEDNVYLVNSTTAISAVTKDADNKSVNLGIINDSEKLCIVRYFTCKEDA